MVRERKGRVIPRSLHWSDYSASHSYGEQWEDSGNFLGGETVQMNSIFDVLSLRHLWDTRVRLSGEQMSLRVGLSAEMKMEVWESLAPAQGLELWLWVRLLRSV